MCMERIQENYRELPAIAGVMTCGTNNGSSLKIDETV